MSSKQPKKNHREGVDEYGRSQLHYAAIDGNSLLVKKLLQLGESPDTQDDDGWSPLHFAAQNDSAETVAILLSANVKVDAQDSHGNTALWRAVFNFKGDYSCMELLLAAGADVHLHNNHEVSPYQLGTDTDNEQLRQFFLSSKNA
jgi:ankyrin repeat protein